MKSSFYVGYWTPRCETWFQCRLQSIRDGTASPRSANKWHQDLKTKKRAVKIVESARLLAGEFMDTGLVVSFLHF
jgi:hypothetical protein